MKNSAKIALQISMLFEEVNEVECRCMHVDKSCQHCTEWTKAIIKADQLINEHVIQHHIDQCDNAFDNMEGEDLEGFKKWETRMIYEQEILHELGVNYDPSKGTASKHSNKTK